ncbi:FtsX-like permease family protein [Arthrobacter sp. GMC3]|uniref:FtsX-like permease family protein n=1 Tax=Arthrobacter sp. GMC3 TaxID=2058894 RepID=UPI001CA4DEF2|nr:FtsX-like permease family protein [Arthrobacter sp. GMC3]
MTALLIAGMCIAVLLTSGRAAGAQQAVLGTLDEAGTRTILVTTDRAGTIPAGIVQKLKNVDGIDWALALGPAEDVTNAAIPGGTKQSLSHGWATNWSAFGLRISPSSPESGIANQNVLEQLGLADNLGIVETASGIRYSVSGPARLPREGSTTLPDILIPHNPTADANNDSEDVQSLVIVTNSTAAVQPVAELLTGFIAPSDASSVHVQTSQRLVDLRAVVDDQLVVFGRVLTMGILAIASTLVGIVTFGLILLRRKEFGRRRALGASRKTVIALVLIEAAIVAAAGALIGEVAAASLLLALDDPMPPTTFMAGIAILAISAGIIASFLPAIFAARREPIVELRVP